MALPSWLMSLEFIDVSNTEVFLIFTKRKLEMDSSGFVSGKKAVYTFIPYVS